MIRALLAVLDPESRRRNVVQIGRIAVYAAVEGIAFGLTLPLIAALVSGDIGNAGWWLLALGVATVATMLARHWQVRGGATTALHTIHALQRRLGAHVAALPVGWFSPAKNGSLPQTLSRGAITTGRSVPFLLITIVGGVVTPAVVLVAAALVDWRPALVMLVAAPVLYLVHVRSSVTVDAVEARTHAAAADSTARVVEFADAQATLRAAGRGGATSSHRCAPTADAAHRGQEGLGTTPLRRALDEQYAAGRADVGREILARAGFGVTVNVVIAAVVATIGWALTRNGAATAVLVALLVLTIRFAEPVAALGDAARGMRQGRIEVRRADTSTAPLWSGRRKA